MAAITKIELWNDVGFIDGAVEIPSLAAPDPSDPDYVIEPEYPVNPSKDRYFSEFKLREFYEELMTVSYMRITYEFNVPAGPPRTQVFYGWVDSVSIGSDGDLPVTTISWHIDEWRTWKSSVTFGSGHVKRRPFKDLDSTPIQNYGYRYLQKGSSQTDKYDLADIYYVYGGNPPRQTKMIWWVIFSFNVTNSGKTKIEYGTFPVYIDLADGTYGSRMPLTKVYFKATADNTTYQAISLRQVLGGELDDSYGIAPSAINGVWLSPEVFDTSILSGEGSPSSPFTINISPAIIRPGSDPTLAYISLFDRFYIIEHKTKTFAGTTLTSSEEGYMTVTDFEGAKVLDLPYGLSCQGYDKYLIIEPDTAYMVFSFKDELYGRTEGCAATIPLPQLPVNENAFSDYVYSGQRDYDRENRTVQSNANAWKSSATGAGQGAMMGAFGPQGLALGMIGGVAGGLISYGTEMLYQNDAEQGLTDRLKANQISGLLMGSNVISATRMRGPSLIRVKPDQYSLDQISNTRGQFGVSVDELLSSTDTLIRTTSPTGYYNIQNLIVSGDIPVSAKRWIRNKFASGVRLI